MTEVQQVALKVHSLLWTATDNGGLWVSAGGGTANVIAGELSRAMGCTFAAAHAALDAAGGKDWYGILARDNSWADDFDEYRWDAKTVVNAALRHFQQPS